MHEFVVAAVEGTEDVLGSPNDLVIGESVELHSLCPVDTPLVVEPHIFLVTLKRNQQTTNYFFLLLYLWGGKRCLQFCYSR